MIEAPPRPTDAEVPADWSAAELATLTTLADTLVPDGGTARAVLAAAALELAVDPGQVGRLRLALRLLESRAANLLLTGRPVAFSQLEREARERYLLGWGRSRLALRRSAYQAFCRLLMFLAYADPGDGGEPNPRLVDMGYVRDDPGVTASPTPIRPFALPSTGDPATPIVLEADVAIVGSGASGGVVAKALAEAGRSVVVLEAGSLSTEPDMPRAEIDAFDRLYLDHGLTSTSDGSISILAGSGIGGGTTINWMTSIAAPDPVRAGWARAHGIAGFDAAEGDADYAAIAAELSVTETAPIPPKDALLVQGATALGLEAGPTRRNAAGCDACGSCPFGCRAGSKQSGLRAHLADAWRAGARIVPGARVERVLLEGGSVGGVEATLGWEPPSDRARAAGATVTEPRTLIVRARQVVVAAGALRTPVVLERSGIAHPVLGRYLLLHPVAVVAGFYAERVEMWRGPLQASRSLASIDGVRGRNGYAIESAPGHPGLIALTLPWEGAARSADLMRRVGHLAPLIAIARDGGTGRVRAAPRGARIDYRLDRVGVATLRHGLVLMAGIARAAGAEEIVAAGTPGAWFRAADHRPDAAPAAFERYLETLGRFDFGPNRGTVFSAHQMGTARFGDDPSKHACDPFGRVRTGSRAGRDAFVKGLYVADTSLFPTGLGVNPMLTVMALARRVARTVLSESASGG